jgi:hypothetical protein
MSRHDQSELVDVGHKDGVLPTTHWSIENKTGEYTKRISAFFMFFLLTYLCSCTTTKSIEVYKPELLIPIEKMNSAFKIKDMAINNNSYKNGDILLLDLENLTSEAIIFPGDFNIMVYQKVGNEWIPVTNNLASPQGDWSLPTYFEWRAGLPFDLMPFIPNLENPTSIRIFAFGKTEKTGEVVGAYIDILLCPCPYE